jgi:hypothetical protein
MVHELEGKEEEKVEDLLTYSSVWRYRPHINVDHFFRQFELQVESHNSKDEEYLVIRLFKKEV